MPLQVPVEDSVPVQPDAPVSTAPAQKTKTVHSHFTPVPLNRGCHWQKSQAKALQKQFKPSTVNPVHIFANVTKSQVLQFLQQLNLNTLLSAPNVRVLPTSQVPSSVQNQWCQPANVIQLQDIVVPSRLPALEQSEVQVVPTDVVTETSSTLPTSELLESATGSEPELIVPCEPVMSVPMLLDPPAMDPPSEDHSDYDLVTVTAEDISSVQMPPELQFVDEDGNIIPDIDAIPVPMDPPHASTPQDVLEPLVVPSTSSALPPVDEDMETVIELILDEEGINPRVSPIASVPPSPPPTVVIVDSDEDEDLVLVSAHLKNWF